MDGLAPPLGELPEEGLLLVVQIGGHLDDEPGDQVAPTAAL